MRGSRLLTERQLHEARLYRYDTSHSLSGPLTARPLLLYLTTLGEDVRLKSRPRSLAGAKPRRCMAFQSFDRTCRIKNRTAPYVSRPIALMGKQFINVQITSMLVQAGF